MSSPDLSGYRAVHTALRTAPHRLAAALRTVDPTDGRRLQAIARYWKGYAGEVLAHHTVEDVTMFPRLLDRAPSVAGVLRQTDADHHHLDELMATCTAGMQRLATGTSAAEAAALTRHLDELAALMDAHLDLEDAEIIPLFEHLFTGEEYAEMEEAAMKSIGVGPQAMFTVPFVLASVDEETRASMVATAPGSLRFLYRMTRRRHARLARLALGPVVDPPAPAGAPAPSTSRQPLGV